MEIEETAAMTFAIREGRCVLLNPNGEATSKTLILNQQECDLKSGNS